MVLTKFLCIGMRFENASVYKIKGPSLFLNCF